MDPNEKCMEYFVARYSLIPDAQIDCESYYDGKNKEQKFMDWLQSFKIEKKKEVTLRKINYILYCKMLSDSKFYMSFAKETDQTIGHKTEDGIIDTSIKNYRKCNIFINTTSHILIIEKNNLVSAEIGTLKNMIAKTITRALEAKFLYMEIELLTEKNNFWNYVTTNHDMITDIEIKLSSPNILHGITSVSDFLHDTNNTYNNTSIKFRLTNEEGKLLVNPDNPFLQDAIRYSAGGCGNWKIKSKGEKWYKDSDNPFILTLPKEVGQLKASDLQDIEHAFEKAKHLDPEHLEG